jgi:fructokinase
MPNPLTVLALGEILWDVFPERTCFGGAPANYACALSELAGEPVDVKLFSGVGRDPLGQQALEELEGHGVGISLVQRPAFPTGQVSVHLTADGNADYRFAENVAWDNLQWTESLQLEARIADVVCFGTLAQRASGSAATLQQLVKQTSEASYRVFDINLRFPHVVDSVIHQSLALCNVLKLNEEELPYLADLLGISGSQANVLKVLYQRFDLRLIALTQGAKGAVLFNGAEQFKFTSPETRVVDTVGAGDAFTAALTLGLLRLENAEHSSSLQKLGEVACRVAAFVCEQPGATPSFPADLKTAALF